MLVGVKVSLVGGGGVGGRKSGRDGDEGVRSGGGGRDKISGGS